MYTHHASLHTPHVHPPRQSTHTTCTPTMPVYTHHVHPPGQSTHTPHVHPPCQSTYTCTPATPVYTHTCYIEYEHHRADTQHGIPSNSIRIQLVDQNGFEAQTFSVSDFTLLIGWQDWASAPIIFSPNILWQCTQPTHKTSTIKHAV